MLIYWILLAIPLFGTLVYYDSERARSGGSLLLMMAFFLFYNAVSALRVNTGGDWDTYSMMAESVRYSSLEFALQSGDQGFMFMLWLGMKLGFGIFGVNALCSMFLSWGVIAIARRTPSPWLAIAAAVPYLLIVVGLGYIRQGAAIGFILLSITAFADRRWIRGGIFFVLAMMFHVAAIIVAPILGLALGRRDPLVLAVVGVAAVAVFAYVLTGDRLESFQIGYIDRAYSSGGAGIRLTQNVIPALFLFVGIRNLGLDRQERSVWMMFGLAAILCWVTYFFTPSSTAIDRLGLFFSPIQIFAFGYFMALFDQDGRRRLLLTAIANGYFVIELYVWLNYATHSMYWVPYHSVFDSVVSF